MHKERGALRHAAAGVWRLREREPGRRSDAAEPGAAETTCDRAGARVRVQPTAARRERARGRMDMGTQSDQRIFHI